MTLTRTNSRHQRIETTQTYIGRPQQLPLSTGSEIEAEEDARIIQRRYRGTTVTPTSTRLMPIFLKAVPKLEATEILVPPPQDEQCYRVAELISQPVRHFFSRGFKKKA